jgi:hypothetical protein
MSMFSLDLHASAARTPRSPAQAARTQAARRPELVAQLGGREATLDHRHQRLAAARSRTNTLGMAASDHERTRKRRRRARHRRHLPGRPSPRRNPLALARSQRPPDASMAPPVSRLAPKERPALRASRHGASRTRTGDLLGAIHSPYVAGNRMVSHSWLQGRVAPTPSPTLCGPFATRTTPPDST